MVWTGTHNVVLGKETVIPLNDILQFAPSLCEYPSIWPPWQRKLLAVCVQLFKTRSRYKTMFVFKRKC